MTHVDAEIASQPDCWQRALDLVAAGPTALPGLASLPRPGERVAVAGCGTSLYIGAAYAALRESAGQGETDAFPASELPAGRRYDRVVALTRSGTTTEVLQMLHRVPVDVPTVAITADPETPVGTLVHDLLPLDFADERSIMQTRFATTCLVLLRAHLGLPVAGLPEQAAAALAAELPTVQSRRQFTFLGTHWTVGVAHEAALKLREAAGAWTEAYPAMEYRHGPISAASMDSLVWIFGTPPAGLLDDIARTGASAVTSEVDPLADLVRAQRLAVALARHRRLDPDRPRHLTRSVVLAARQG